MLDRSKCKKMWVWDRGDDKCQRIVLDKLVGRFGCICVSLPYEEDFIKGKFYHTCHYENYEEIPEPKKRLMTREEVFGFVTNTPGILVNYDEGRFIPSMIHTYFYDVNKYVWKQVDVNGKEIQPEQKFMVEE